MHVDDFLRRATDAASWRTNSRALRRSADALWTEFGNELANAALRARQDKTELNVDAAVETLETAKLLYGLALETALKAWLIEKSPDKVEIRVTTTGDGTPVQAELRSLGVPTNQGHNLMHLADAAGLFGDSFAHVAGDTSTVKNICRDLGEAVVWRGRYPVPLSSYEPGPRDPKGSPRAHGHFLRDWLDPILDALLDQRGAPENAARSADA